MALKNALGKAIADALKDDDAPNSNGRPAGGGARKPEFDDDGNRLCFDCVDAGGAHGCRMGAKCRYSHKLPKRLQNRKKSRTPERGAGGRRNRDDRSSSSKKLRTMCDKRCRRPTRSWRRHLVTSVTNIDGQTADTITRSLGTNL